MPRALTACLLALLVVVPAACSPSPPKPIPRSLTVLVEPASFPIASEKTFEIRGVLRCDPSEDPTITGTVFILMENVAGGERRIEMPPIHREKEGEYSYSAKLKGYQLFFKSGQIRVVASFGSQPPVHATTYFEFNQRDVESKVD